MKRNNSQSSPQLEKITEEVKMATKVTNPVPVLKPSQIITKQTPMTSNTRSSGDLLLSREIASLASKDISKDSSVNLIQKAHEMYN